MKSQFFTTKAPVRAVTGIKAGTAALRPQRASRRCALRPGVVAALSSAQAQQAKVFQASDPAVQEMMDFLAEDLNNLFNDQGVDASRYGDVVDFQDPITKYDSLDGYLFNIKMLRAVFNPEFILHGIWQSGPNEITSRWTMNMELSINQISPFRKFWDPKLTFTGLSIYTMDSKSGKIIKHVDYWDAIQDQKYLSLEAVGHLISQVTNIKRTPVDLKGPKYTILKKRENYEVRLYEPYTVAKCSLSGEGSPGTPSVEDRRGAFQALAKYIFGANKSKAKMAMTTPVLSDDKAMRFYLGTIQSSASAPAPEDENIEIEECPGGIYAVAEFSGLATESLAYAKQEELRGQLKADGHNAGIGFTTARYNDPSVQAIFRRNEVLVPLEGFKLLEPEQ